MCQCTQLCLCFSIDKKNLSISHQRKRIGTIGCRVMSDIIKGELDGMVACNSILKKNVRYKVSMTGSIRFVLRELESLLHTLVTASKLILERNCRIIHLRGERSSVKIKISVDKGSGSAVTVAVIAVEISGSRAIHAIIRICTKSHDHLVFYNCLAMEDCTISSHFVLSVMESGSIQRELA